MINTASKPGWNRASSNAALTDLVLVAILTVGFLIAASALEFAEQLHSWTSAHESWQLDELLLTLFVLVLGLGWFGWRRLREVRAEASARNAAEHRTTELLEDNRGLAQQVIQAQELERRNIARELHDELGQCCNAIKLDAATIERQLSSAYPSARDSVRAIIASTDHMHHIVREMLHRLRPLALDELGLVACLQEAAEAWERRHGIACVFLPEGELADLHETVNITVYRIVQECLTNIARHAGAEQAIIRLKRNPAHSLTVCVEDNGHGPSSAAAGDGLGILGMTERVRGLGGTFVIEARAGGGLRVMATIPAAC